MKNNWKKILNELSYRVSSGIPDLTNEQHLMKLWDILKEHNWNVDARVELIKNLQEKVGKVYIQKGKGPSGVKLQVLLHGQLSRRPYAAKLKARASTWPSRKS